MGKPVLEVREISVSFREKKVLEEISFEVEQGKIYSIIGRNGCGKTTLLRTICRSKKPDSGHVYLQGEDIFRINTKKVARSMAILSQHNESMSDVTVEALTGYGRFSHKKWYEGTSAQDKEIVEWALERTGMEDMRKRKVNTLSGGERQRAWMSMLLAQKPKIMLLDEPTTYLDISHQLEIMELVSDLNRQDGITILMVLHDINPAARYSDELIVIDSQRIYRQGRPWDLIQGGILEQVFHVSARILESGDGQPIFFADKVI